MYVYVVTHIARVWINRIRLLNPARGQLKGETNISLSPFAPENLVSRDGFGSPVPRQPAHLNTQAESGVVKNLNASKPSNQSKGLLIGGNIGCRDKNSTW